MTDTRSSGARPVSPLWGTVGWVIALLLIGLLYFFWEIASQALSRDVQAPAAVFAKLGQMTGDPRFWEAAVNTLVTWLAGFVLGFVPGLAVGIVAGHFRAMASLLGPSVLVVASVPIPFVAILLVLWAGMTSDTGGILAAALATFATVSISLTIARNTDWTADFWRSVFRSLGLAAILALAVVVFVEMIAGTAKLGTLLLQAMSTFDMVQVFALGLTLWALALLLAFPFLFVGWLIAVIARVGARSAGGDPMR